MFRNEIYERHAVILPVFLFVLVVCFWSVLNTIDTMELFRNHHRDKRTIFLTQYINEHRPVFSNNKTSHLLIRVMNLTEITSPP